MPAGAPQMRLADEAGRMRHRHPYGAAHRRRPRGRNLLPENLQSGRAVQGAAGPRLSGRQPHRRCQRGQLGRRDHHRGGCPFRRLDA